VAGLCWFGKSYCEPMLRSPSHRRILPNVRSKAPSSRPTPLRECQQQQHCPQQGPDSHPQLQQQPGFSQQQFSSMTPPPMGIYSVTIQARLPFEGVCNLVFRVPSSAG
jgi:hypothetical protein